MSYRKIEVDGKEYEYSIGRSHLKFRGGPALPYDNEKGDARITPKEIKDHILKLKAEGKI